MCAARRTKRELLWLSIITKGSLSLLTNQPSNVVLATSFYSISAFHNPWTLQYSYTALGS